MKKIFKGLDLISIVFIICITTFGFLTCGKIAADKLKITGQVSSNRISVEWKSIYPFDKSTQNDNQSNSPKKNQGIFSKLNHLKVLISSRDTDVPFERKFLELNGLCLKAAGMDIVPGSSNIVRLKDGHLVQLIKQMPENLDAATDCIKNLSDFSQKEGAEFLYVQVPDVLCDREKEIPESFGYYNNIIINDALAMLKQKNINYIDLRENIHSENKKHSDLFFKTDHHWMPETGRWAASNIIKYLNTDFNLDLDSSLLASDNFDYNTYNKIMLGSRGQNVTLGYTSPEDFTTLIPYYDTDFRMEIPTLGIDTCGDFNIMINSDKLKKDYYKSSSYSTYLYGNNALTKITNNHTDSDKKILLIKDSYGNCVAPYLALTVKETDVLDIRDSQDEYFNGSVQSYIKQTKPDVIILLYYQKTLTGNTSVKNLAK